MKAFIRLIRPRHWVKNSLVFAAIIFAQQYLDPQSWIETIAAFVAISLTASAIYIFNDIQDREYDRQHPVKKNRPIASGAISIPTATLILIIFLAVGLAVAWAVNTTAFVLVVLYAVMMILYSLRLKHALLLDVFIIAAGLVLRAILGAVAIEAVISNWLLICAFLLSLVLALVKRRQELARLDGDVTNARRSLKQAPPVSTWDHWISSVAGISVLAYILYTVDPITVAKVGNSHLLFTAPFVLYAMFRYLAQVQTDDVGEDPVEALLHDPAMILVVLLWLVLVLLVLTGTI